MWDAILINLDTASDLWNSALADLLLSGLLQRQKPTFLFPKCLPHLLNYVDSATVLRFRQVCKTWRNGVEFLLQNGPHLRRTPQRQNELVPLNKVPRDHRIFDVTRINFTNFNDIRRFITEMRSRAATNPFPGRSVNFNPTTARVQANELVQYEAQLRQFLTLFGAHLWRFQYKLPIYETPMEGHNNLIYMLHTLPHVKTVHFEDGYHWLNSRVLRRDQDAQVMGDNNLWDIPQNMLMLFMERPIAVPLTFPPLPYLVEINVPNQSLFHGDYLDSLVEAYGSQVLSVQWINSPFMGNIVIFRVNERFRRILNFGDDDQAGGDPDDEDLLVQVEEVDNDQAGEGNDEVGDFFDDN